MSTHRHDGNLSTYDESWNLSKPHFIVDGQFSLPDIDNFEVHIYDNVKSGHMSSSVSEFDEHPSIYWLIPHVIAQGRHHQSTSKHPDHLARLAQGHTEVYQLDNIYEKLDNVSWSAVKPNHSMVVPVFYPYDGRPNKAISFYIVPNLHGRQIG